MLCKPRDSHVFAGHPTILLQYKGATIMKKFWLFMLSMIFSLPVWAAVNINSATEAELQTLSGIGPSKAKAIVEYRQQNGSFKTTADIKNVKGIGDGIFKKIETEISVGVATAKTAPPKPATNKAAAKPTATKPATP